MSNEERVADAAGISGIHALLMTIRGLSERNEKKAPQTCFGVQKRKWTKWQTHERGAISGSPLFTFCLAQGLRLGQLRVAPSTAKRFDEQDGVVEAATFDVDVVALVLQE